MEKRRVEGVRERSARVEMGLRDVEVSPRAEGGRGGWQWGVEGGRSDWGRLGMRRLEGVCRRQ